MGNAAGAEIDTWLRGGGLVVAASERAARAVALVYHRARRAEGLIAWPAPNVLDWQSFDRVEWEKRGGDRMAMSPMQEQSLWVEIVKAEGRGTALLEGPRYQASALAMDAHRLLCAYAPRFLSRIVRSTWQQDAGTFSNWLQAFEDACGSSDLISEARLPLELLQMLETDALVREPILLAGFDRILPAQQNILQAWGAWQLAPRGESAAQIQFHEAADTAAELAACALWCKRQLSFNPRAHLLVVTQSVQQRRGEMERAFLRHADNESAAPLVEFSLGVPLKQVALARGAHLLLHWLTGPIEEHELDWLLSTGQLAANAAEERALTGYMRALRRRGLERTRWPLEVFLSQRAGAALPEAWAARMRQAKLRLEEFARRLQTPLDWAQLIPYLLQAAGWPGYRPLSSAEYQARRRWLQTLDECASLGFNGRRMSWNDFLSVLDRALGETLFAPESQDVQIQVAGAAQSAGLTADAIWFMGASEEAWPARGSTNPLLPFDVQRDAAMPHATPKLDWDLAKAITERLLSSAPEVHFSYARQDEGVVMRPSRLIAQLAKPPQPMPVQLAAPPVPEPRTEVFDDLSRIPFAPGDALGGSSVLTSQSQCPFKAFASARLGAVGWEPAQAGLNARQRGQLLHAVLHSVWGGPPAGIRTYRELIEEADLESFVRGHVRGALSTEIPQSARESMPNAYLELEEIRLIGLVMEWLEFERTRTEFSVYGTEVVRPVQIAGLSLNLRLDRIDKLNDGSLLVIDYKSGDASTNSWELPRPDDVQLPLYAGFALDRTTDQLGGLVFGKVRAGNAAFVGRVFAPDATLFSQLGGRSAIVRNKLTLEQLFDWRDSIRQLAQDFLDGRANVDPRDYPKTCERCELHVLCRVQENGAETAEEDDEEADDE